MKKGDKVIDTIDGEQRIFQGWSTFYEGKCGDTTKKLAILSDNWGEEFYMIAREFISEINLK